MNNRKTPRIRFKGFTDDWEQRKFEEVFIERREKTEQENEDTLLSCTINGMFLNSELFGHFRGTTTIGYLRVKKNDLILSAQNLHLGNANVNLRFEHGIISPAYKVYDLNSCDPEFVQAWVKKDNTKNFFLAATTEGASQCRKNIEWETLGKQTISMPSMDEQRQIGVYFRCLDHLITLHQRKLEKLKIVKKAMLENCFPKNGEKVPKFRFSGFTGDWEQRKLGELAFFNPKEELPDVFEYVDLESVVGTEMLFHRTEEKSTAPSRAQRLAYTGDLFYQTVRPYQKNNYLFEKSDKDYVFSTGYAQLRPFVDGYFLLSLVQNGQFVKTVLDNCTGTSYPAINANDLAEIEVFAPKDECEHHQIGTYFRNLDHLITLHQRKLEKLKIIKKSFLEKMFV